MTIYSVRSKIFIAFLCYSLLGISIAGIAMWYFSKVSRLNEVATRVDGLLVECLELLRYEQAFLSYDQIDPEFFETGTSDNLRLHRQSLTAIDTSLTALLANPSLSELEVGSKSMRAYLGDIRGELSAYESEFTQYVSMTKLRGFKDYGLVGKMRESAHEIEAHPVGVSMENLLMLRRHEKDYIIRKDQRYAGKLSALANQLTEDLATATEPEVKKTLALIQRYQSDFERMVEVETKMGMNNRDGIMGAVRNHADALAGFSNQLSLEMVSEVASMRSRQTTFFIALIAIGLAVSLLLSYIFSGRITRPLRQLKRAVEQTVQSDFQLEAVLVTKKSRDEVGALTRDFEIMLRNLHQRLDEINAQSRSLGNQNDKLQLLNQELEASREELEKINGVKDKIFSIISHDFRSPLNSLLGYLGLFEENAEIFSKEQLKQFANDIKGKVKRLLNVLENTLQWSLQQSGQLEMQPGWCDLEELANEGISLYEDRAAAKSIRVRSEIRPAQFVWADKRMVHFLFRNIISNAIKFSRQHTEVRIYQEKQGDRLRIFVEDRGVGMSAEQIQKVLDSSEHYSSTGTDNESGTGFGIALCIAFARRHGGELQITSFPDEGTTVSFDLPLQSEEGISYFQAYEKNPSSDRNPIP